MEISETLRKYYVINYTSCSIDQGFLSSWESLAYTSHFFMIFLIPLYIFGAYCILYKTPEVMKSVKWSLFNWHVWSCIYDITVTSLMTPYFFFPLLAGFPVGLLALLNVSIPVQLMISTLICYGTIFSMTSVFENRYNILPMNDYAIKSTRVKFIYYGVRFTFFSFTVFSIGFGFPPNQEQAVLELLKQLPCPSQEFFHNPVFVVTTFIIGVGGKAESATRYFAEAGMMLDLFMIHFMTFILVALVLLSFVAALQRFIVLKYSNYTWIVTGNYLLIEIFVVYIVISHYGWVQYHCLIKLDSKNYCADPKFFKLNAGYNVIFLTMNIISGCFYIHIYSLLGRLSEEHASTRARLLFQLVPIYIFQMAHSVKCFFEIITLLSIDINELKMRSLGILLNMISAPWISIIICVSYIASKGKLRKTMAFVINPFWKCMICNSHQADIGPM